jgi:hypothetical protein
MFGKSKVSQSMIDAVNSVIDENAKEITEVQLLDESAEKVPTPTGMKVYGSSYGNSKKARQDQTKSPVDTLKGPKDKEVKEELKGNQDKIDANHNDKIDAQDFKILQGKKKVKEEMSFAKRLVEKAKAKIQEKKDVVMPEDSATPAKNTDIADKSYLKDMGKKPTVKSDLKNLGRFLTGKKETNEEIELTEEELDIQINEVLSKDASAGDWIHDFVHSDNPKFAGKSTAERKKMALGAYYGAQKEAYEPADTSITTDTLVGRLPGGKVNGFKSYKVRVKPLAKEEGQNQTPEMKQPEKTVARTSIKAESTEVDEATIAGTPGWKEMPKNVTDKSGAVHTPMSRAKGLAKVAFKVVQDKTKVK